MRPGSYINKLGCKRCPLSLSAVNACVSRSFSSKLSQCRAKLEPNILSTCQPMGAFITEQTHAFIEHVNTLKWFSSLLFTSGSMSVFVLFLSACYSAFIPPASTRDNAQKWYQEGFQIVDTIVKSRNELVQKIEAVIKAETELLKKEHEQIRVGRANECEHYRSLLMCLNRRKYAKRKFTTMNKLAWFSNVISSRYSKNASVSFKNPSWTAFKYVNLFGVYEWSWFNSSDVFGIHRYFE